MQLFVELKSVSVSLLKYIKCPSKRLHLHLSTTTTGALLQKSYLSISSILRGCILQPLSSVPTSPSLSPQKSDIEITFFYSHVNKGNHHKAPTTTKPNHPSSAPSSPNKTPPVLFKRLPSLPNLSKKLIFQSFLLPANLSSCPRTTRLPIDQMESIDRHRIFGISHRTPHKTQTMAAIDQGIRILIRIIPRVQQELNCQKKRVAIPPIH